MTSVWGFDPSKCTGWAIFSPEKRRRDDNCSHVICGVLEMPPKSDHYFTGDQISQQVQNLFMEHGKPDFVVLEEQAMARIGNSSADGMLYPWIASIAIVSVVANWGVPYATLPAGTWRKAIFGQGYKPPQKTVKEGGKFKLKNDWKTPAIERCEKLGVQLPRLKAHADDAAEAALVSMCWEHNEIKFHAGRYQQPWIDLRQRRNDRGVAA
ncbi:crossover junction endodeoxyribonuclease RuvC [Agrobacterium tumefaciens]|uniref:hypothetical protein n=1 Tax=Agrobacterium tumefaciens TaxID=358 RepID=UPI00157304E9|nr:hypothetical protein [Agrobacterium tumefaciens]NTA79943.1 crossover junction endodeoxyribonuclease RuvC [Agrobacterium tumefaciens]